MELILLGPSAAPGVEMVKVRDRMELARLLSQALVI
jgi:hypothetical protein